LTNLDVFLPVSPFKKYFPRIDTEALVELTEVLSHVNTAPGET
jgi:hypothetical protein|tara:strand:- start:59 stop:187 length:129 start_codon:yes stop_codon:yes gene_type:complete